MAKITEKQLETIQQKVNVINQNQLNIGNLEVQKSTLINNAVALQNDLKSFQDELEKEYGKVSINISTGEYEEIKEEESK